MWTSFCSGRMVCLIILAAALLVSSAEVAAADTYVPVVVLSCCSRVSPSKIREKIKACYEQKPRVGCTPRAFRVITESNKEWCISPAARWLRIKIKQGGLLCKPELS